MSTVPPTGPLPPAATSDLAFQQARPAFELNMGQQDPAVRFLARLPGSTAFFTTDEAVFVLGASAPVTPSQQLPAADPTLTASPPITPTIARVTWIGSSTANITGTLRLPGRINYFIGNDPTKWHTNIPTYGEIVYHDLYPGVDMVYATVDRQLKSTYHVAPGADPSRIRWRYEGTLPPIVDAAGNLQIRVLNGAMQASTVLTLTEQAPIAWQDQQGQQVPVTTRYTVAPDGTVGFNIGNYDHKQPLVLDPILTYSTFLGGSSGDGYDNTHLHSTSIVLDAAGNMYVAGHTESADFPGHTSSINGGNDAFIAEFNPSGTALIYFTYLGGSGPDGALALAVTPNDSNIYVGGWTESQDFPTTPGSVQDRWLAGDPNPSTNLVDGFIVRLDSRGAGLTYASYLGANGHDAVAGIAVDALGNLYLTGTAGSGWGGDQPGSPNLITRQSHGDIHYAYQEDWQTSEICGFWGAFCSDGFFMKLNPNINLPRAQQLLYSTYFGTEQVMPYGIAIDSDGNGYITGCVGGRVYTGIGCAGQGNGSNPLPTKNPIHGQYGGSTDAFVAKFNPNSAGESSLIYSTYAGSTDPIIPDEGRGIVVNQNKEVYFTGWTKASTQSGLHEQGFITKINSAASQFLYTSTFGGNGDAKALSIALDGSGNTYVTGSATCATLSCAGVPYPHHGGSDAFVASFNGTQQNYFTYLGSDADEEGEGITVDFMGNAYVTGYTGSQASGQHPFPLVNPYQNQNHGGNDVFIARFAPGETTSLGCTPNEALGAASTCAARTVGSGVNTLHGNYWYTGPGLALGGDGPGLAFVPSYNSQLPTQVGPLPLGLNWTHSYNMWITHDSLYYHVHMGDGSILEFPDSGTSPPNRYGATLTATAACRQSVLDSGCEFLLKTIQDRMTYSFKVKINDVIFSDHTARLAYIQDRYTYRITLDYNTLGSQALYSIRDTRDRPGYGRNLVFHYTSGLLDSVTLTSGSMQRSISFTHLGNSTGIVEEVDEAGNGTTTFVGGPGDEELTINFPGYGRLITELEVTSPYRVLEQSEEIAPNTTRTLLTLDYVTPAQTHVYANTDPGQPSLKTVYSYDSQNRIHTVVPVVGGTAQPGWTYDYSPVFPIGIQTATDPRNHIWRTTWDPLGNILSTTAPGDPTVTYTYYPGTADLHTSGEPTSDSNLRRVTTYERDESGAQNFGDVSLIKVQACPVSSCTGPSIPSLSWHFADDHAGAVGTVTDPWGATTVTTYDTNGYVETTTTTQPGSTLHHSTTTHHDALGQLEYVEQPRLPGHIIHTDYAYWPHGELQSVTVHPNVDDKPTTEYHYDAHYNLSYTCEAARTQCDSTHYTSSYEYYSNSQLLAERDGEGHRTVYGYFPNSGALQYTQDPRPGNYQTTYTYDDMGRLEEVRDPYYASDANHKTRYTYLSDGNLETRTEWHSNGTPEVTTYGYYDDNRLHTVSYSNHSMSQVSYQYYPNGLLHTMNDGTGQTEYHYDWRDRVTTAQDGHGQAVGQFTQYDYNDPERTVTVHYPVLPPMNGVVVTQHLNALGWLQSLDLNPGTGSVQTFTFNYDDAGLLQNQNYPNNTGTIFNYDEMGHLSGIAAPLLGALPAIRHVFGCPPAACVTEDFGYTRDANERLDHARDANVPSQPSREDRYHYTPSQRLDQADTYANPGLFEYQTKEHGWTYDEAGNLHIDGTSYPLTGEHDSTVNDFGGANELQTSTFYHNNEPPVVTLYDYDANGDRLHIRVNGLNASYKYDAEHRLLSGGGQPFSYRYDGSGLRTSKRQNLGCSQGCPNTTTYFTWSSGGSLPLLLQEQQETYTVSLSASPAAITRATTSYIYGPTGILAEVLPDHTVYYYHNDQIGSVRLISDHDGAIIARYNYDAYGNPHDSTPLEGNPFGFTGEYTDRESGLIYLRSRYYSPGSAQFLTRDTVDTQHPYAYGDGSPVNGRDPSGHILDEIADAAFIIGDIIDIGSNGLNWENGLALAADVGGAALPFVTGGGAAVHAAFHADNVVRFAAHSEVAPEFVLRALDYVGDFSKPRAYRLRTARQETGLSTFSVDAETYFAEDLFSRKGAVVRIPTADLPDGIHVIHTPGDTSSAILNANHWELVNEAKLAELGTDNYIAWWRETVEQVLADRAKARNWVRIPRP
jgi:RHS repeat-associated protein